MLSIICTIAVGALAGWIADKIVDAPQDGLLFHIAFGISGAIVGNILGKILGIHTAFLKLSFGSIASAVIGAILVSFIIRKLRK